MTLQRNKTTTNAAALPATLNFMVDHRMMREATRIRGLAIFSEREYVQRRSRLHLFQLRRAVDEPLIPSAAHTDENRDILLTVDREGHRRRIDAAARIELPKTLQRLRVERVDLAGRFAGEHEIRRGEDPGKIRIRRFMLADNLARRDINRGDAARDPEGLRRPAAGEEVARLVSLRPRP